MKLFFKIVVGLLLLLLMGYGIFYYSNSEETKEVLPKTVLEDHPYNFKVKAAEDLSEEAFNLAEKDDYNQAIKIYHKALKLEPDNPKLYFDLSNCYMDKKQFELAIFNLSEGIKYDSNYFALYNNRGLCYYQLKADNSHT